MNISLFLKIKSKDFFMSVFILLSVCFIVSALNNDPQITVNATTSNYYVDCVAGNDTLSGNSQTSDGINGPWKSLEKIKIETLPAGSTILLKRGCEWNQPLIVDESGTPSEPITVKNYGTGALPVIRGTAGVDQNAIYISGQYITISNLDIRGKEESVETTGLCINARKGSLVGVNISNTASNINLTNNIIDGFSQGLVISDLSQNNKVLNNIFSNNSMMSVLTSDQINDDKGATSINVLGNLNEIANNTIIGNNGCSYDYGKVGTAIEISTGSNNSVHHNKFINNLDSIKIYGLNTSANTFAYNLVRSNLDKASLIITDGINTRLYNNTAYLSAPTSSAVQCKINCSPNTLTLKNNIIWSEGRVGDSDAVFDERDNIYWRTDGAPQYNFQKDQAAQDAQNISKSNPYFVNVLNFDFHLLNTSPAIDSPLAQTDSYNSNFFYDLDGRNVPLGENREMGAYEFVAPINTVTPMPSITATPTATISPTMTPTVVPSSTPIPTSTPIITSTPTPSATSIPTIIPTVAPTSQPVVVVPMNTPTPQILGVMSTPTPIKLASTPVVVKPQKLANQAPTSTPTPSVTPTDTPTPTVTPTSTDGAKLIFDFESGKVFENKKPAFSGKATPNMDIEVAISPSDKKLRTKSDTKGDWLVMMSDEMANGDYKASAFIIRSDGTRGQEFGPIEFKVNVSDVVKKDKNLNNMLIGIGALVIALVILGVLFKNKRRIKVIL